MPDPVLLKYRSLTDPSPLQASNDPDNAPENSVTIAVAAPRGQKVYCKEIQIAVPVGPPDDGGAYFTEPPQSTVDSDKWQPASAETVSGRALGFDDDTNYHHVVFRPKPVPGFDLLNYPLSFTLDGTLATPGAHPLPLVCLITETSGPTSGACKPKDILELDLPVARPAFRLDNFTAYGAVPGIPTTRFDSGDEITLVWESNGSRFTVYGGDGTAVYDGVETTCAVGGTEAPVVGDTTFTLLASAPSGFRDSDRYATLTITVNNPTVTDLTVREGGVTKFQTAGNDTTVYGRLDARTNLDVAGQAAVNSLSVAEGAEVNGPLNANDDLTVNDKLTTSGVSGLTVSGDFTVDDKLTTYGVNGLRVSGDLTVDGKANLASLFQEPVDATEGEVDEDGLLYVSTWVEGTSGTLVVDGWLELTLETNRSFTIPLRRGQSWSFGWGTSGLYGAWWIPFR